MPEKVIMSAADIRRALVRIAHEIVERNRGVERLILIGMRTRGVPLAGRIATAIETFERVPVAVGALDIGLYRDDLSSLELKPIIHRTDIPVDIAGKRIILIDDVLYTGRSIRAALDALTDLGRPQSIQLAVLIDRGHRELPIRADYVGKNVPTAKDEEVEVNLKEIDGKEKVAIVKGVSKRQSIGKR